MGSPFFFFREPARSQHLPEPRARSLEPTDVFLLFMVVIWGANYSVVKVGLAEIPPRAFNSLRLVIAIGVYLTVLWLGNRHRGVTASPLSASAQVIRRSDTIGRVEWMQLTALGFVGHFLYQICFVDGLAGTSVANSSLILALIPAMVTLSSAAVGHERISGLYWAGLGLSLVGIYLVVGRGARLTGESVRGDVLTFLAVVCWAIYSVGARPLLARHSPLAVTSYTMGLGGGLYALWNGPALAATDWSRVTVAGWSAVLFSSLLALNVGYLIWYAAVQRIGNARTSVYSNVTPLVALAFAALWLGEPVPMAKLLGAIAIIGGVMVTRVAHAPRR